MPAEVFVNVGETTLAVAALSTDTTLTLLAGAPFPAAGQYRVRLDDSLQQPNGIATRYEICRATFNAGNVINGFRTGADLEGTTAQAWPIGTAVRAIITAGGLAAAFPRGTLPGGYAQVITSQGPSAPPFPITGASITVTVGAGRRIRVSCQTLVYSSVGTDTIQLSIYEGATVLQVGQTGSTPNQSQYASAILTPTAGTHSYFLSVARVGTGNLSNYASATQVTYILAEDIGV